MFLLPVISYLRPEMFLIFCSGEAEGSLLRTGADFTSADFSLVAVRVGACSVRDDLSVLTGEEAEGCLLSDDLFTLGSVESVLRVVEGELFTLTGFELLRLALRLFMLPELFCSLLLLVFVSFPRRFTISRVSEPGRE
jgi:hypothetical protein